MNKKEFARELEKRTREFAVRLIRLSRSLPDTPEGKVIRTQITKPEHQSVQIIEKPIGPEAKQILRTRLRFVKVKPAKHSTA